MIELNLLKEGHGILYQHKKPVFLKWFMSFLLLSASIAAISLYLKEDIHALWYIFKNEEQFIDLNVFFEKPETDDKIALPLSLKTFKEKEFPKSGEDVLPIPEPVTEPIKTISVKKETVFDVIAGTCILKESADDIVKKLKKAGFNSSLKKTRQNVGMYAVLLGEFDSAKKVEKIKAGLGKTFNLELHETGGKYILRTSSTAFSKEAERILKKVKRKGVSGKLIKIREEKKVFVVVVKSFDNFREASILRKKLKNKKISSIVSKVKKD